MNIAEAGSGLVRTLECGLAGIQNRLVNLRLSGGEGSIDGERAGDVCGVERINLDTGIDQNQVTIVHRTVVIDPVQGVRVVSRGGDGVVAQAVSFFAGYRSEGTLNDAFAAAMTNSSRQRTKDIFESSLCDLDCATQLRDLKLVLAQADF